LHFGDSVSSFIAFMGACSDAVMTRCVDGPECIYSAARPGHDATECCIAQEQTAAVAGLEAALKRSDAATSMRAAEAAQATAEAAKEREHAA